MVDSDMYLSIFIAATNRFARSLSIAIDGINRFDPRSIDSHWHHQYIWKDIDRYIWSASMDLGVAPQHTTAQTIVWETDPSIDTAATKERETFRSMAITNGNIGIYCSKLYRYATYAVYCPGCVA